jgi:plastocyanin
MGYRWSRDAVVVVLLLLGLVLGGGFGAAVHAGTPEGGDAGSDAAAHPAHVHAGTCAELDPLPIFPLTDVAPVDGETAGAETAISVEESVTTLDVPLADLLADDYAINVHESADNVGRYIACGDIGGAVVEVEGRGSALAIGLGEESGSGYSGVARLQDDGDGVTTVTIFLARDQAGGAGAEPAAGDETDEVTIEIVDFFFEPAEVTVKVGTTVTWVNVGPTDHTTTAYIDGDKYWDSAIMSEGDTYSFTVEEPGTFEYLCALHPSMTATLIVEE